MEQRLIDADALREKWLCLQGHDFSPSSFVYSIDNESTVDAVPVEWIRGFADRLRVNGFADFAAIMDGMLKSYFDDGERTHG